MIFLNLIPSPDCDVTNPLFFRLSDSAAPRVAPFEGKRAGTVEVLAAPHRLCEWIFVRGLLWIEIH